MIQDLYMSVGLLTTLTSWYNMDTFEVVSLAFFLK